jgi:hypothetical protein
VLQQFKQHSQVPAVVEKLLRQEPANKAVQGMYLSVIGKHNIKQAFVVQQSLKQPIDSQDSEFI